MTTPPDIKVTDLAFVRFGAPDLDIMEKYFTDFGMQRSDRTDTTLYMRGSDDEGFIHVTHLRSEPGFIGLAFEAESVDDLEKLAGLEGFSDVGELGGPGGGSVVSTTDPNGFQVEIVAGRSSVGRLEGPMRPTLNDGTEQPRQGVPLRLETGPSHVKRLGHIVLGVKSFRETEQWYKQHFGLVTSDEIAVDENMSVGAFMRCDRGAMHVDHHTLACIELGEAAFNHAAFEVANFDDLMVGHTHLHGADGQHAFGVGRHLLGSQIYDYWVDPYGHMVEHWTDGDLLNNQSPPNMTSLPDLAVSHCGPLLGTPPT